MAVSPLSLHYIHTLDGRENAMATKAELHCVPRYYSGGTAVIIPLHDRGHSS